MSILPSCLIKSPPISGVCLLPLFHQCDAARVKLLPKDEEVVFLLMTLCLLSPRLVQTTSVLVSPLTPIPFSHHNILVIHLASYWISSVASRLRYSITAVHLLYMLATIYLGFEMVFTPMCFSKDNLPPIHSLYLFLSHHTLSPASHTLPLPVFVSSHSLSPCCAPVNSFPPA